MIRPPRPSRSPIALWAQGEALGDFIGLVGALRREPIDAGELGVSVLSKTADSPQRVLIGYRGMSIGIPVIGQWPLNDLSPYGLLSLLMEIEEGRTEHREVVLRHAMVAVALCKAHDRLPGDAPIQPDGSCAIEVCLDDCLQPTFWIERRNGTGPAYRLPVDPDELDRIAGPMLVPCHIHSDIQNGRSFAAIGQSMSEEEGIHLEAPAFDAMETLAIHRRIQETNLLHTISETER